MHDYGRDHVHDRGHDDDRGRDDDRDRDHDGDDDRHNGSGHGHGDDGHDHDGDDDVVVHHGCVPGYFLFSTSFIHNKPPRGLHRPTVNNKKTYSTFTLFFKSTILVDFKSYLLNMF